MTETRKTDYPTGNPNGMSFINNRWVFTGPQGYRVQFDGEAGWRVYSYAGSRVRPAWWDDRVLTEDEAHAHAASLAQPSVTSAPSQAAGKEGMPTITIRPTYTLTGRERGRQGAKEVHTWDEYCDDVTSWAVEMLRDAGITRMNRSTEYITEEPQITDFRRGEETTATATLEGFTAEQLTAVASQFH